MKISSWEARSLKFSSHVHSLTLRVTQPTPSNYDDESINTANAPFGERLLFLESIVRTLEWLQSFPLCLPASAWFSLRDLSVSHSSVDRCTASQLRQSRSRHSRLWWHPTPHRRLLCRCQPYSYLRGFTPCIAAYAPCTHSTLGHMP